jgi:hypothetical protein
LRRRGADAMLAFIRGGVMADERRDYAILVSLYMREEAEVMASALRADGIDAFVGNSQNAYFNWHYIIALGGLQVMVPRAKLEEARDAVRARIADAPAFYADDSETAPVRRRDRYKLWMVIGGYLGLVAFYEWADRAYQEQYERWYEQYWAAQAAPQDSQLSNSFPLPVSDPLLKDYCIDMPNDSVDARVDDEIRTVPCAEILQQAE